MKTILFLMNGFGIETKNSYSIYDAELMPTFDELSRKYMFSTLNTRVRSIYEGFRNMSLEVNELYNYHIYQREALEEKILKNSTYNTINNELTNRQSKLHIYAFVDTSEMIIDNLKHFLRNINKEKNKKIFLHLVLTNTNYEDYPQIIEVLSKINIELNEYATIGVVLGLETILNSNSAVELNFFLKMLISEFGEKWQSFNQKLDVSYRTKKAPTSIRPFIVNNGFTLEANDLCMIWNYDNIDISNFINSVKNINYGKEVKNNISFYSLFPITYNEPVLNVLNYEVAKNSLATNMQGLGFKTLVLTETKYVNAINYYLNGLESVNNPNISYLSLDNYLYDVNTVVNIINKYPQELIIFNYDLSNFSSVEEFQGVLRKMDALIKGIYDNAKKNSHSLIISSIYGVQKTVPNAKGEICHIEYDKVPIVYIDSFITKANYVINNGDIDSLFRVCYKTINKKYPGDVLITKKNLLYRLIFK